MTTPIGDTRARHPSATPRRATPARHPSRHEYDGNAELTFPGVPLKVVYAMDDFLTASPERPAPHREAWSELVDLLDHYPYFARHSWWLLRRYGPDLNTAHNARIGYRGVDHLTKLHLYLTHLRTAQSLQYTRAQMDLIHAAILELLVKAARSQADTYVNELIAMGFDSVRKESGWFGAGVEKEREAERGEAGG
jgi:hypothetical protein